MLKQLWGQQYLIPADITGDELLRYPDDGSKYEVYEGMLVKGTMTSTWHGLICQRLGFELELYVRTTKFNGLVLQNALFDLTPAGASQRTILAPDMAVTRPGMLPAHKITQDIPLIAIEVVSPSQTLNEIRIKAAFYRGVGVDEVWLIDPQGQIAEMWTSQGQAQLIATQPLVSVLLPGFGVPLSALFA